MRLRIRAGKVSRVSKNEYILDQRVVKNKLNKGGDRKNEGIVDCIGCVCIVHSVPEDGGDDEGYIRSE